jgi:malate synthase
VVELELRAPTSAITTDDALAFVAELHREFGDERQRRLAARSERARAISAGERPDFLPSTAGIRSSEWRIDPVPVPLRDRRVEITGPVDAKMMINALNSGA